MRERYRAQWTCTAMVVVLGLLLGGCWGGGSVIVDHAVRGDVEMRDEAGHLLPGEVVLVAKPPNMLLSFDFIEYRAPDLVWSVGAGDVITNRASADMCLHFDQAKLTSNFRETPVPLSVSVWAVSRKPGKPSTFLPQKRRSKEPSYFTPPGFCIEPGERVALHYSEDLRELFPNGRHFNTGPAGEGLVIADKGIGNWISMRLPMTVGNERRTMDIKLIATDAKARISYF